MEFETKDRIKTKNVNILRRTKTKGNRKFLAQKISTEKHNREMPLNKDNFLSKILDNKSTNEHISQGNLEKILNGNF